jgi:hypothetical protein
MHENQVAIQFKAQTSFLVEGLDGHQIFEQLVPT